MAEPAPPFTHHFITANDGTPLSYYTIGTGPSILLIHGAGSYALTFRDLAVLLSKHFTVNTMSRRGRGRSGPYPAALTSSEALAENAPDTLVASTKTYPRVFPESFCRGIIATDIADIRTVATATGAEYLLGHSSGAVLTLNYLITYYSPDSNTSSSEKVPPKVILYEPPLFFSDLALPEFHPLLSREAAALAKTSPTETLITAIKAAHLGPMWFLPRFALRFLVNKVLGPKQEAEVALRKERDGEEEGDYGVCTIIGLAGTIRFDWAVGEGGIGHSDRVKGIREVVRGRVLAIGGDKSVGYLQQGLDALERLLGAKKALYKGAGHELVLERAKGGQPERVVDDVVKFFTED
ncbi:Alpha/Beta hydrolase protein [Echria macrotheca]|uniref:Alpha/Beta hydrolase protein n=1 Tax=Echria macrotheca TaxID=438768 RepID=A0AAJ0BHD9_9PEZI|nr:Alpha/Beta hydrolase protein [Echria macrotheca]